MFRMRSWCWSLSIVVVIALVGVFGYFWLGSAEGQPEHSTILTLKDAEKLCQSTSQAGLDATNSELEGPLMEPGSGNMENVTCAIDASVGEWPITQNANATSLVAISILPEDAIDNWSDESDPSECTAGGAELRSYKDTNVCVAEKSTASDQSSMDIVSNFYMGNVDVEITVSSQSIRDGDTDAFPELEESSIEVVHEVNETMIQEAFSQLDKMG